MLDPKFPASSEKTNIKDHPRGRAYPIYEYSSRELWMFYCKCQDLQALNECECDARDIAKRIHADRLKKAKPARYKRYGGRPVNHIDSKLKKSFKRL